MPMPNDYAVKIYITGAVQGVSFRAFVKRQADDFNVNGFVKNLEDGSVYIEAQGDPKLLKRFISACKHGPDIARIDGFVVEDAIPTRVFGFNIVD